MDQGYRGLSFPFRIGGTGGVVMSQADSREDTHLIEAIEQILRTAPMERGMEYHFKSDIDTDIFEPNDPVSQSFIAYQVKEALRELEDRIVVDSVLVEGVDNKIYAKISYTVKSYNKTGQANILLGNEVNAN